MRRLKLYLDTSVISHLFADDALEKMQDTDRLWEKCKSGEYEIYISDVVINEIRNCAEPKRGQMLEKIRQVDFQVLSETDEISQLAREYIKGGVLREKSIDDCLHIAYAVINNCDVIVSWNFKHLVNYKTINKIKIVNIMHRYKEIGIITPTMLIEGEDE